MRSLHYLSLSLCLLLVAPAQAARSDFPTHELAYYVYECMADHGGNSWGNLYNCSCKIDALADRMTYDQFVALNTAKRGRRLAGERGGVLRETEMAENLRERMGDIEAAAEKACFQPPPGASSGG